MATNKLVMLAEKDEAKAVEQLKFQMNMNPQKYVLVLRLVVFLLRLGEKREYDSKSRTFKKVSFWKRLFTWEFWVDLGEAVFLAEKIAN